MPLSWVKVHLWSVPPSRSAWLVGVRRDDTTGEAMCKLLSRSKFKAQTRWTPAIVDFLVELQEKVVRPDVGIWSFQSWVIQT